MADFRRALQEGRFVFFDGGMGTMLQARGLTAGVSPEVWCLSNPDVLKGIHLDYARAGANVLTTNTFGGTRFKMPADIDIADFNRAMANAARRAADEAGGNVFVAGSVGPTGHFLKPLGDLTFEELVEGYKEQMRGLVDGGVDLLLMETHFDIAELRAAIVAAREVCSLPVGASMTFENGVSLTGTSPEVFVETVANMGVDLVATNCSAGPEQMVAVVEQMLAVSPVPVLVMPNAGLPELDASGNTVFRLNPTSFAEQTRKFAEMGVRCMGGCCGTTPDHIAALCKAVADVPCKPVEDRSSGLVVTSRASLVRFGARYPVRIIGERINPTGKKQLISELQNGQFTTCMMFVQEQLDSYAPLLDVNVGAPMVDETVLLPELIQRIVAQHPVPLAVDTSNMDALEKALTVYPASPLVNSISGEPGRMERLGPLCRKYGAPFILLPLKGRKLPVAASERIAIIEELLAQADSLGIPRRLIMVDVLALAVSSKAEAARACLETVRYCTDTLGLPTTIGLSNISFGLPARGLLNSTFLTMAAASGLSSCIAHPGNARIREALAAAEVLLNRDPNAERFIADYAEWKPGNTAVIGGGVVSGGAATTAFEAVVKGDKDNVIDLIRKELEAGVTPFDVVNRMLIPAITEVGDKYERKEYFLPQLLRSAETMQHGFAHLKPMLEDEGGATVKPTIIMATVEGDIHDIGKNIVCLMLGNHGFNVVDLGKDVKAQTIVEAAAEHGAKLIGLSALMTTTMVRMQDTIDLLRERGMHDVKVMVGGAVVTQAFADAIGAHGYSLDAVAAVRLAQNLVAA
ncbi:homocysteine S-methyltransferase family protein [Desulfovibrio subterraneus]|uniref:homocysteine S-methyltransferase family protein n=1 Tax=Desulfovibrio subterraneus TaxID=2718620 RepID=UPI0022B9233D|nr:homocysteine S-methyltransferase family protein [Desulfovibrio subterraneus]WBF68203.1 homocysteine S-methyltransferase family protein [Desulfovibrio subterraneus]